MSKRNAFTLIELLVVISIITLLIAILLPALRRARNNARTVVCQSNLKQWGTSLELYLEDNEGRFPQVSYASEWFFWKQLHVEDDTNGSEIKPLNPADTKYIGFCPMAVKCSGQARGSTFESWETKCEIGGEILKDIVTLRGSYGFNNHLFFPYRLAGMDVFLLKGRSGIPALLDSSTIVGVPSASKPPSQTDGGISLYWPFCINRHNGHVNCLFLDWSVRKTGLKELWTLKWCEDFDTAGPYTLAGGVQPDDWPQWMRNFKDY